MIASVREKKSSSRLMIATVLFFIAFSVEAFCQESPPPQPQGTPSPNNTIPEAQPEVPLPKAESPETPSPEVAMPPKENTAEACHDRVDNDKDSWVDCDDQDCFCMVFCAQKNKCPQSPQVPALTLDTLPHIRRTLVAAEVFHFSGLGFLLSAPIFPLVADDHYRPLLYSFAGAGESSYFLSAILTSSALSAWHARVLQAGYKLKKGPAAGSWFMTALLTGSTVAWWIMGGLMLSGHDSAGLTMGFVGVTIATPLLETIKLRVVDRRWKKMLERKGYEGGAMGK